jgi:hypothetical protein
MNMSALIVACSSLLASITPQENDVLLTRCWKQAMCAFQMLAIVLIAVTVAIFTILLIDFVVVEYELTLFISLLCLLWGLIWLVKNVWLKSKAKIFMYLPQWIFWFVGSGLLYIGAKFAIQVSKNDK